MAVLRGSTPLPATGTMVTASWRASGESRPSRASAEQMDRATMAARWAARNEIMESLLRESECVDAKVRAPRDPRQDDKGGRTCDGPLWPLVAVPHQGALA